MPIMTTASKLLASALLLAVLAPRAARAEGGTITGKVDAMPAKFLGETFVYLKRVDGHFAARTLKIDQKGMQFIPHMSVATVGDKGVFENHDAVFHNVFSKDNGGYNVGTFGPNQSGEHVFDKPGVYSQLCSIHPEMLAYIFVGQNPFAAAVDKSGKFTITGVPAGTYEIAVWNPQLKAADQKVTVADGASVAINFSIKR
jgi:plastocyanin